MKPNNKKESVINGKNVLKAVTVANACLAVAAVLAPTVPLLGGMGLVCSKAVPAWLRGHVFL